ncbi:aldehyde dehydrogenase family protein [Ammoniphilus sp. CFH 90114]|uniref:aldehyde dehydrogenase family protein n=1 Tax=Ammoniphilus sp. CFH 90114 TaxID=2493665 RepID=UPI00100EC60E|nr:aldehyde dehydrogenase family protein [Ammoniphilus sp. CFH 90114]RXT05292.1 aldehyde dehydrogenase family protein [Ammoniphilus sp. CFH 90114]
MEATKNLEVIKNFIDGQFVAGNGTEQQEDINPADRRDVIALVQPCTEKDALAAVEAASRAFRTWKKVPAPQRGAYLFKAADIMEAQQDELARLIVREMGKTLAEAQKEVAYAVNIIRFYAGEGTRLNGGLVSSDHPDVQIQLIKEPMGVVLAVTPWNFPLSIPAWKIAPAIVAGNTVVFKPSSDTPLVGMKLMEILQQAGLPAGVVNGIVGPGRLVSGLIQHPAVQVITFTGSNRVGNLIYQEASKDMKRVQLEMGGKNPLLVLDDADIDLAVDLAVRGGFAQAGQACTATSRVIVQSAVAEEFTQKLVEKAKQIKVGNGMSPGTEMGPQATAGELASTLQAIQDAVNEGAVVLAGGYTPQHDETEHGYYVNPTVLGSVTPAMKIALEEVFGPVIGIIEVESVDEAIEIANQIEFGLSSAVCTKSLKNMNKCLQEIEAGLVKVNMPTTGTSFQAPFGGYKGSSNGIFKELGSEAIDIYTRTKTGYILYS